MCRTTPPVEAALRAALNGLICADTAMVTALGEM
jgi:hypothetical protein